MTNQHILEQAIKQAITNGWVQNLISVHRNVKNKNDMFMQRLEIDDERIYFSYDEYISVPELIFNHDFAKALWGGELPYGSGDYYYQGPDTNWGYNLQQMVISDDPIKYLGEHLND